MIWITDSIRASRLGGCPIVITVCPSDCSFDCPSANLNINHIFFYRKRYDGMYVPYDKTFPLVIIILNMWPWTLTYFNIGHNNDTERGRSFIFGMCIPNDQNIGHNCWTILYRRNSILHMYSSFWDNDKVKVNVTLINDNFYHHKVCFVVYICAIKMHVCYSHFCIFKITSFNIL